MKETKWKKEIIKECSNAVKIMKNLSNLLKIVDSSEIEGDYDPDELGAFALIKISKMQKEIDEIF